MLGFGISEIILIFLILLILFGPKELPGLARFLLRMIHELKAIFHRLETEWKLDSTKSNTAPPSQKDSSQNENKKKSDS